MHDLGHHCIVETAPNPAQLTVDLVEVYLTDLVHHVLVVEGDKPEAAVSVSDLNIDNEDIYCSQFGSLELHLVVCQHGLLDLGELLEVRLHVLETGGGREPAHEDLLSPHHQLGVGLTGDGHL